MNERLAAALGDRYRIERELGRGGDGGFYPDRFIAEYCPFLAPLRGTPEFDRIAAKAERRVAEFDAGG